MDVARKAMVAATLDVDGDLKLKIFSLSSASTLRQNKLVRFHIWQDKLVCFVPRKTI